MLARVKSIGKQKAHSTLVCAVQSAILAGLLGVSVVKLMKTVLGIGVGLLYALLLAVLSFCLSYAWLQRKDYQLDMEKRRLVWANISVMLILMVLIWI